jgi:hypothetical protein
MLHFDIKRAFRWVSLRVESQGPTKMRRGKSRQRRFLFHLLRSRIPNLLVRLRGGFSIRLL